MIAVDSPRGQVLATPQGLTVPEDRHPGTRHFARLFAYGHLRDDRLREASEAMAVVAAGAITHLPDGPELTAGLRKLLEAKDCFVRAALP